MKAGGRVLRLLEVVMEMTYTLSNAGVQAEPCLVRSLLLYLDWVYHGTSFINIIIFRAFASTTV